MFESFHSRQPFGYLSFLLLLVCLNRSLNVKKFSRIVCVSLFSYQGFPLVCFSDSSFILSHLFLFVKNFFQVFSNFFESRFRCRFVDDLDTLSYLLSFVNCEFHFSEILFNCLLFENNYLRQLSYITIGFYACQP